MEEEGNTRGAFWIQMLRDEYQLDVEHLADHLRLLEEFPGD